MSDPVDPTAVDANSARGPISPGRHHVHLSYVVLKAVSTLKQLAIGVIAFGFAALPRISDTRSWPVLFAVAAVGILAFLALLGFAFVSYKHFSWELTESELHIYEGLIFKKETHIPFKRIHSIDYSAKIIERVLGVVSMRVETAGGGAKAEAEITALRLSEAEALRFEIFARKRRLASPAAADTAPSSAGVPSDLGAELARLSESARGAFAGEYEDLTPVEYEYHLTIPELLIAGVSNSNVLLLVVAVVGGASQVLALVGGSESAIIDYAQGAAAYVWSFGIAIAVLVAVVALLFAWTISTIATVISYGGFSVRRRVGRVEVERGLLEHHFNGVAIDRIQSVRIKQGALRRLIGFAEVSLEIVSSPATDSSKAGETGLVVHPLIRRSKADAFIAELLPEFALAPTHLAPLPGKAWRRSVFHAAFWPALLLVIVAVLFNLFAIPHLPVAAWVAPLSAVILVLPFLFLGHVSWTARRYARDTTTLVFRNGALALDTRIVPRNKIQWAQSTAGPFQRRLGLASVSVWTAAGVKGTAVALHDVDAATADDILQWIEPRVAQPAPAPRDTGDQSRRPGLAAIELP